jgi:hypothetical protein
VPGTIWRKNGRVGGMPSQRGRNGRLQRTALPLNAEGAAWRSLGAGRRGYQIEMPTAMEWHSCRLGFASRDRGARLKAISNVRT